MKSALSYKKIDYLVEYLKIKIYSNLRKYLSE